MKRISFAIALVLVVSLFVPAGSFAGTPPATPPADSGDQAGQGGGQNPGQNPFCGLWKFIKKLFEKDPALEAEKLKKLLILAKKDLELCLSTIDGKDKKYLKVFPAVAHLNHALSAIDKGHPPKHLKPCFKELTKRISHAKFYLVAYDFDEASARIEAAKEYIGELN